MPMVYGVDGGLITTSNATPDTENDFFYVKPGTGRQCGVQAVYISGKGAALTAISGITVRGTIYPTTGSSAGTAITPSPRDPGYQASKFTAGSSATTVTSGTGTRVPHFAIGCGAAGPGGWVAPNPDSLIVMESAASKSFDLHNQSGTASLKLIASCEVVE
jgi:hypothetical protein